MKKQPLGVADNKSYKDQYHFRNVLNPTKSSDLPSLDVDPPINTTIKKNPYRSNVEIEGGEVVLEPDMTALFKAVGKKHKGGGMDVLLKPDAFIFSDDKTLSFSPGEKKLFEFKEGGKYNPRKNTPAQVLKKNVPPKHYNTLINNIKDVTKDNLAKKSSAMMLEKYIDTLGNIAYLQEAKKDFPDGLPDFSRGTAPVFNPNVKQEIMESKQYSKYGGKVNPYKASGGYPDVDPECPCGRLPSGKCVEPCSPSDYQKLLPSARKVTDVPQGYKQLYQDPNATLYGKFDVNGRPIQTPGPKMSNAEWTAFVNSPQGKATRYKRQGLQTAEDYVQTNPYGPTRLPGINPNSYKFSMGDPQTQDDAIHPNTVVGDRQPGITADWEFTPDQKISQLWNWGQYASAKRYDPFRSHYNATYAEPSLLNPEQAIGDVKGAANQQLSSLNTLNPILRNAQASSIYGKVLDTTPGIRSQYDNQNAGITNQFRQYNNQVKNDETKTNLGFDQQYYQQSVEGRKNFDNLRSALGNQAMDERNSQVQENQSLAYNLLTRPQPIYDFDFRRGRFTRKPGVDIRDIYSSSSEGSLDAMMRYAKQLKDQGFEPQVISALLRSNSLSKLAPYLGDVPTFGEMTQHKKGGKVKKKNPYRY